MAYSPRITQVCAICTFRRTLGRLPRPFLATRHVSMSDGFGPVGVLTYPICPSPSHVPLPSFGFFSRGPLSLAALMSLKRKYSHEPDDGTNGDVGSQGSDAVSLPIDGLSPFSVNLPCVCFTPHRQSNPFLTAPNRAATLTPFYFWLAVVLDGCADYASGVIFW